MFIYYLLILIGACLIALLIELAISYQNETQEENDY